MEDKREDSRIVDYLYGEMSAEEKAAFKKELDQNPGLRAELEAIRDVRDFMTRVEDEEIVPPSFVFNVKGGKRVPFFRSDAFRWIGSVAASLALLLLAAYGLDFNVVGDERGFHLGFGEYQAVAKQQVTKEDVQSWMKEVMAEYDQNAGSKLADLENKLVSKMDQQDQATYASVQSLMKSQTAQTDQLMRDYVSQLSNENRQMIENFFVVSNETQREYVQSVLADFNDFYQNQRNYDLKVIETSIDLLKNNYDVQQLEQDNLLANLYSMVQTQNK